MCLSSTLRIVGQSAGFSVWNVSVPVKNGRKCCTISDPAGANGKADMYICGTLCEMTMAKLDINLPASAANANMSASSLYNYTVETFPTMSEFP
jgi:hypothetical protein